MRRDGSIRPEEGAPLPFRHEEKYLCSEADLTTLGIRLSALMRPDPHADAQGRYRIRSVYFDDAGLAFWHENEMGVSPRQKWRIRSYNGDPDTLRLECKYKVDQLTAKQSAACPAALTRRLLGILEHGEHTVERESAASKEALLESFLTLYQSRGLHPSVIVSYERTPFIYAGGNVRVTFDRYIHASCDFTHFFDPVIKRRPILPGGVHILEVKYDEYLPQMIADAIQMHGLRRVTFSKYALCRKQFML